MQKFVDYSLSSNSDCVEMQTEMREITASGNFL